jgi:hypothetical protein
MNFCPLHTKLNDTAAAFPIELPALVIGDLAVARHWTSAGFDLRRPRQLRSA